MWVRILFGLMVGIIADLLLPNHGFCDPVMLGSIATALPWLATTGTAATLGGAGAALSPWVVPAALGAGGLVGNMVQGNQAKVAANTAAREARSQWKANAFPSDAAVNAQATQNRGQFAQARLGAIQNVASNRAARGFGSGSGEMAGAMGDINKGYLESLGNMNTELIKFKNTPMFGFPQQGYGTPNLGGLGSAAGNMSDMLEMGAGLMFAKQMYPNMFSGRS